jgi:hypothetical protein
MENRARDTRLQIAQPGAVSATTLRINRLLHEAIERCANPIRGYLMVAPGSSL